LPLRISFADLTHTGQIVAANVFPYGTSLVAAHAKQRFGDEIDVEIFKYPNDYSQYIETSGVPQVACFSNYLWNSELSLAYARHIKAVSPRTITIFGGPNYPMDADERAAWLAGRPEVDFYIPFEGERPCAFLLERLFDVSLDAAAAKRGPIPGVHFIDASGTLVTGEDVPRIEDLTETPSPYVTGLLDKFFDGILIPVIETNRGCPFQCAFCEIGRGYFNKVRHSSLERVRGNLEYIADRVTVPDVLISDSNFGMLKRDVDVCHIIREFQDRRGWPKYVQNSSGKNQKERVLEAARILNGALVLTVSIQSADERVLENVRRKNISIEQIIDVGRQAQALGANSYCEIILSLPGDSRSAHVRSVEMMLDAGINDVLTYQAMMLPGAEISSKNSRAKYGLVTRFRVLPRCFGHYYFQGRRFSVVETEEICVSQDSLSFEDYIECRRFNLTVEIFYNGGVFGELIHYLKEFGIPPSRLIRACHHRAGVETGELAEIYDGYMRENQEKLWEARDELRAFAADPGVVDRFISGELGSSELYKYKSVAFFEHQEAMHDIAFASARDLLLERGSLDDEAENYLTELRRYSLLRKNRLLDTRAESRAAFHYDFVALQAENFEGAPRRASEPATLVISHTPAQRELIDAYLKQYGTSPNGLGRLLLRSHVDKLYRTPRHAAATIIEGPRA